MKQKLINKNVRTKTSTRIVGPPKIFNEAIAEEIVARMMLGESMRSITKSAHIPHRQTINKAIAENTLNFFDRYEKACQARAQYWAEELVDIADDSVNDFMDRNGERVKDQESIARSRLRIDTRKWILSKLVPKYHDKSPALGDQDIPPVGSVTITVVDCKK